MAWLPFCESCLHCHKYQNVAQFVGTVDASRALRPLTQRDCFAYILDMSLQLPDLKRYKGTCVSDSNDVVDLHMGWPWVAWIPGSDLFRGYSPISWHVFEGVCVCVCEPSRDYILIQ